MFNNRDFINFNEISSVWTMFKKEFFIVILLLTAFTGCKYQNAERGKIDGKDVTNADQLNEVKEIYYRFPAPDEMLNFIDREKLDFDDGILLPVEKAKTYLDSKAQEMNLGVYIADLAYITLFQRQKEALMYFQVIYGLSEKIRISSAFDLDMIRRYEDNIKNIDSLKALGDEALTDIANYLAKNDKEKIFAAISIGGFVESLYLAFELCGDFSEDNMIVQRISDQKLVLENLINYAQEYQNDQNVAEALEIIRPIRIIYNEMRSSATDTKVTKDESGKLIITGGEKMIITQEQFNLLKTTTRQIRTKITEINENQI